MSSTSNSSSSDSRWVRTKTNTFLDCNGQNLFRTVEKSWKNQTVWSQQSSKNIKKMPHFDHFFRPGEIDPYVILEELVLFVEVYVYKHVNDFNSRDLIFCPYLLVILKTMVNYVVFFFSSSPLTPFLFFLSPNRVSEIGRLLVNRSKISATRAFANLKKWVVFACFCKFA